MAEERASAEERPLEERLVGGRSDAAMRHHAVESLEMSARSEQCCHLPDAASAAGVALPAAACEPCLQVFGCGHEARAPFDPVNCQYPEACRRRDGTPAVLAHMAVPVSRGNVDILGCS